MHGKNRKYSATGGRKARRERALERLRNTKFTPKTIKGKGFSIMENKPHWHYWNSLSEADIKKCLKEIN